MKTEAKSNVYNMNVFKTGIDLYVKLHYQRCNSKQ